jgi:hypothetical protein
MRFEDAGYLDEWQRRFRGRHRVRRTTLEVSPVKRLEVAGVLNVGDFALFFGHFSRGSDRVTHHPLRSTKAQSLALPSAQTLAGSTYEA